MFANLECCGTFATGNDAHVLYFLWHLHVSLLHCWFWICCGVNTCGAMHEVNDRQFPVQDGRYC